jgi:hypothetical protein
MGQEPLSNRSANAATGATDQDRARHGPSPPPQSKKLSHQPFTPLVLRRCRSELENANPLHR